MTNKIHLTSTHSTNAYLRQYIAAIHDNPEYTLVWADFQTAGRGQGSNQWESAPEKNLLFTLLLCPTHIPASEQFKISQVASIAICEVLNKQTPGFQIKWPNDIYFEDKKIGGILIENDLSGSILYNSFIGVGLNINQDEFVSDAPNPISLLEIVGHEMPRELILDEIIAAVKHYYELTKEGLMEEIDRVYLQLLMRKEGLHRYRSAGVEFLATFEGISPLGILTLRDEQEKLHDFDFKEVEFIF